MVGIPKISLSFLMLKIKNKFNQTDLYPYAVSRNKNFQVLASRATKKVKKGCPLRNLIRKRAGDQTF